MAVRHIPTNVRSLTGKFNGQEFESSLERDLLLLVHYDYGVDWYEAQPITIEYKDCESGKSRQYTPDLLVSYLPDDQGQPQKPHLYEVKYREDLADQWKVLKPKYKAARAYAREHGWVFQIMTDKEIRTPYLDNVKFLLRYRDTEPDESRAAHLKEVLGRFQETDPQTLIKTAYQSEAEQGEALWTLWAMVEQGWIHCDLHSPLTMTTRIRRAE